MTGDARPDPDRTRRSRLAWCAAVWRVHVRGLVAGRGWTVLGVLGVAVGITLLVGVAVLQREVGRPFDAFGPQLTAQAAGPVSHVSTAVAGHVPEQALDVVESAVGDAAVVVPVVADLTELAGPGGTAGVLVVGADCRVEALVGEFDCRTVTQDRTPAPGPGMPLYLPARVATALGVAPGDPLTVPGSVGAPAHVAGLLDDDAVPLNGGYVALAVVVTDAQDLLGRPGFLTDIYAVGDLAPLRAAAGALAEEGLVVAEPSGRLPAALATVSQALGSTTIAGLAVGVLIALNTLVIGLERRRSSIATVAAIGASNARVLAGLLLEGCLVGAAGGLIAAPLGYLAGRFLVARFGDGLLAGTGAHLATAFRPEYAAIAVGAGLVCGALAMLFPGRRILRGGPLASMSARGDVRVRRLPWWLAPAGVAAAILAAVIMWALGRGMVPVLLGQAGLGWGILAAVLVAMGLTPPLVHAWARVVGLAQPADAVLVDADVDRYPVMTAGTVATLAIGVAMAVAFMVLSQLGARTSSRLLAAAMPDAALVSPQGPWDQREGLVSDAARDAVAAAAGREQDVAERWRAVLPSPAEPRIVIGIDPGSWFADSLVSWTVASGDTTAALRAGEVGLSTVASGRLGAGVGDMVELPTLTGPVTFRVAGVFEPRLADDTAVGDWVLASDTTARDRWGAMRSQLAVRSVGPAVRDAAATAGLRVLDAAAWRESAFAGWSRFFQPFVLTGWLIVVSAGAAIVNMLVIGLTQRRRERAALRAIGMRTRVERRVVLWQAISLAALAYTFALVTVAIFTALIWVSSPVYYGFRLGYGVVGAPLLVGAAVTVVLVAVAAVWPAAYAGRLDVAAAMREE